jgi:proteasome lid subunit RPN8/RPN11
LAELRERAQREPARECCGLLAGRDAVITHILPATNAASQPATAYEIAPKELFRLVREIRDAGLELMGIYHSHPNGKNEPSARDVEQAYYPDVAYFILSPRADSDRPVRAFRIEDGVSTEIEIQVL